MSLSKVQIVALLLAVAEARFGQEQVPVEAVRALGDQGFGDPGVAATIAGSIPGSLLAAASPCQKLTIADQMITELGNDPAVIDAAKGLVSAETNFNPFAVDVPFVCADASLPATEELRGITPLVDPAVTGSDTANAASAESLNTPFDATGLSQAEVMIAQGFSNFTAVDGSGANTVLAGQDGGAAGGGGAADGGDAAGGDDTTGDDAGDDTGDDTTDDSTPVQCGGGNGGNGGGSPVATPSPISTPGAGTGGGAGNDTGNGNGGNDNGGNGNGNGDGAADGGAATPGSGNLDFGLCQPTMARIAGLNGRAADEFTFIPQDPLCAEGQQEALNPNIITNRICDQLINVCEAAEDAHQACLDAKAQIQALGTRDQSTADTWNTILGFDGVDSTVETI